MTRDYFAEMYVAVLLADRGWNVYFPRRDQGFDFMVTKEISGSLLIRPVQVKGKYPSADKGDRPQYGYVGELTQVHPDMVLAIPFFPVANSTAPLITAFLPKGWLKPLRGVTNGYRTFPAGFTNGAPCIRRDYALMFDDSGMALMETTSWSALPPPRSPTQDPETVEVD